MTLLTVSVGRRPYVHETTGHILLSANGDPMAFDPTADHKCSVTARLNDTGITLDNASWVADLSSEAVLVRKKRKDGPSFVRLPLGLCPEPVLINHCFPKQALQMVAVF